MKVAVTCASGQLGSAIIKACLELHPQQDIVAIARTPEKAKHLGVEVRAGDYDKPEQLSAALQGIDALVLVSGMAPPEQRTQQQRNAIEAAKQAGVKKIVYTSIQGAEQGNAFSPIVATNRQTEQDLKESGLNWAIGRNGIYIEPDIEYIETYRKIGYITNCAGEGRCGYTTRGELSFAYAKMLLEEKHQSQCYNLHGDALSQSQLAAYMSEAFDCQLRYQAMSFADYRAERIEELGEFIGTVIAGIYQGIAEGAVDNPSHYKQAAGREHIAWSQYFSQLKA